MPFFPPAVSLAPRPLSSPARSSVYILTEGAILTASVLNRGFCVTESDIEVLAPSVTVLGGGALEGASVMSVKPS